jgi:DNA-binding MarR family transcriptional regulator
MKKGILDLIFDLKFSCLSKEESICKELKLSPAEFRGIISINESDVIPCNMLSRAMGLSVSRGSRVINKLIDSGCLSESSAEGDKRITNVMLTSKGKKTRKIIINMLKDCESVIFKNLSKSELLVLQNSLSKITGILQTH